MTFDSRSEANIATLTPATQVKARAFLALALAPTVLPHGWTVKVIQGRRTYAEQDTLFAQGRTNPGPIVTNAQAGYSNHNFGRAFDVGIFDDEGKYIDDSRPESEVSAAYHALAPLGKSIGLFWGGDWRSIDDEPHYELTFPGLSEDEALAMQRKMVANGEVIA